MQKTLYLGNLKAKRDWGHAKDYVEAQWKILQHNKPDDFCIATGKQYSVKTFVNEVCKNLKIDIQWKGIGLNEVGINKENNKIIIRIDKRYFRPTEVNSLLGDISKAKKDLKWKPKISFIELVKEMTESDYQLILKEKKSN